MRTPKPAWSPTGDEGEDVDTANFLGLFMKVEKIRFPGPPRAAIRWKWSVLDGKKLIVYGQNSSKRRAKLFAVEVALSASLDAVRIELGKPV